MSLRTGSGGQGQRSGEVIGGAESESLTSRLTFGPGAANHMKKSLRNVGQGGCEAQSDWGASASVTKFDSHYALTGKTTPGQSHEHRSRSSDTSKVTAAAGKRAGTDERKASQEQNPIEKENPIERQDLIEKTVLRDIFLYPVKSCGPLKVSC